MTLYLPLIPVPFGRTHDTSAYIHAEVPVPSPMVQYPSGIPESSEMLIVPVPTQFSQCEST